ncbi:MAG: BON domain-containing protein [Gammaproteobacteria bacterium]|nr:BON domain-containing protein [Gammaproteobacteria bacterium]
MKVVFLIFSFVAFLFSDVSLADSNPVSQNSVSDTAITGFVKAKIAIDSSIPGDDVSVTTNNNVVSLSGTLPSDQDANNLINMVQSINGVKAVDTSHLSVKRVTPPIDDAAIAAKVKAVFIKNKLVGKKAVPLTHIQIASKAGVVALSGTTGNQSQIDNAIKLAKQIPGVKDVQSTLTVDNHKEKVRTKKMAASH